MRLYACLFIIFCLLEMKAAAIEISAECACVIEQTTGEIVFEKNSDMRNPMASTTKIMTAIVALENSKPYDVVTASRNAVYQEGSSAYLREGDCIYMRDLLYGLMLNSGNDAAVAAAEHISGDTETFAEIMTRTAKEVGAENTHFVNPSGLYDENHYTTARDLAVISSYAMKNPVFRDIVKTKTKEITTINTGVKMYFSNHNKFLKSYDGANGIKTGYTKKSGRCLVSSAERDGVQLIAVTLNAPDDWKDHETMLNYGFSKVNNVKILDKNEVFCSRKVSGTEIFPMSAEEIVVPDLGYMRDYELITLISENLSPPINKNEKIGVCDVVYKGKIIKQVDILSSTDVYVAEKNMTGGFFGRLFRFYKNKL